MICHRSSCVSLTESERALVSEASLYTLSLTPQGQWDLCLLWTAKGPSGISILVWPRSILCQSAAVSDTFIISSEICGT